MSQAENYRTDDRLLLLEMQKDSMAAFDAVYEKYWELVYNTAYKRLRNGDLAKDITQDIFLKLWAARHKNTILNLAAYLHTAVRNNVFKLIEKEQRYIPIPELVVESQHCGEEADTQILHQDFLNSFANLVDQLTTAQQEIFKMRFDDDQSTIEISKQLGISRKTVQNQLGRSIAFLRTSLAVPLAILITSFFLNSK